MSREKQKGTSWETAIVNYLREVGWPHVERRATTGVLDRGDIAGLPDLVIEAKNAARVELAGWLDEATREAVNAKAAFGVVWFKRRGRRSPGCGFVLMSGNTFARLLHKGGW